MGLRNLVPRPLNPPKPCQAVYSARWGGALEDKTGATSIINTGREA